MPKKSIWALDIGAWSMKIARGRRDRSGALTVDLYDEVSYHGLGVEADTGPLAGARAAVEEFAGKYSIGGSDDLCVSVSGGGVFSRFINLPPVPDSVDEIIQYEAMQQIPFDMDQVVWDYQPVKEEHEPWEEVKVGLFALKTDMVDELTAVLNPWRRNLRIIQQAPLAVFNYMCYEGYDSEPTVVLDIGGRTTSLVVIDPPGFWLRSLLVGGDALTERIESHFGVSRREAERIKERASESGKTAQLLRVVGKPVGDIISETQRSLGYYKSSVPDVKFSKVVGVGNAFRLKGLDRVIAEGLQTEVEVFDGGRNLTVTGKAKSKISGGICGCCALFGLIVQCAGEGRIRVNMVPERIAFENEMRGKKPFLAAAVAGIFAIAGVLILGEAVYGRRVGEVDRDAGADMARQVAQVRRDYTDAERRMSGVERDLNRLVGRQVRRDYLAHVLSELTLAVPQEAVPAPGSLLPEGAFIHKADLRWRNTGWNNVAGGGNVLEAVIEFEATVAYAESDRFVERLVESFRERTYAETGMPVFRNVQVGEVRNYLLEAESGEVITTDPYSEQYHRRRDDPDTYETAKFRVTAEFHSMMRD